MIALSTTTISVKRAPASASRDQWDEDPGPATVVVASGVRAVIWTPTGTEQQTGATHSLRSARLSCDPCDMAHTDEILDEVTGDLWEVLWVQQAGDAFGLGSTRAGLALTQGVAT